MTEHAKIVAVCVLLFGGLAQAATITVGPGAGYDFGTIQAGINAASEGDTVIVAMGRYNENIHFSGANIVLTSTEPEDPEVVAGTVIDGYTEARTSCVTFTGNEDGSCELRGFTITGGSAGSDSRYGGGIRGNGSKAATCRCVISGNYADGGGAGIYDCDGPIRDCVIRANRTSGTGQAGTGGGLYNCDGPITNCIIENNEAGLGKRAGFGGGLHSCHGMISDCTISNNSANENGGGLHSCNGTIINCTIGKNWANGSGGGLYNCDGLVADCIVTANKASVTSGGGVCECDGTISNCTIRNNEAAEFGGGLYGCKGHIAKCIISDNEATIWDGGGLSRCGSISHCLISGNSAGGNGGGVHECHRISNSIISSSLARNGGALYDSDAVEVVNCTVTGNQASKNGGAIWYSGGDGTVGNCILWGNTATEGDQIYLANPDSGGVPAAMVVTYTDVQGGLAEAYAAAGSTLDWHPSNIEADPCFVRAGHWAADTTWIDGDYHLLPSSPCIDAGAPDSVSAPDETDLDGNPRIVSGAVDMGAYEFQEVPTWYVDVVNGNDNNSGLSHETAFATIQTGIDRAGKGNRVLVYPGVYREAINFLGRAITVQSAEDAAVLQAPGDFAVSFYMSEGPDSVLTNFVITNSYIGIFVAHSSPTITNVTVVNNTHGIEAYGGAEPHISNSILWNNTDGDLFGCQARYCCIQRAGEGPGNLNIHPLFVDSNAGDYHLMSERGRYWPKRHVWLLDKVTSPCIDHGDPTSDCSNEPVPNGGRINMGAYGGTAYASMKEVRWNAGDANHDSWINMMDLAILADSWLKYEPPTSNQPPEVNITAPLDGAVFQADLEQIEIEADAWDTDGVVVKVEFFANGDRISEDVDGADGWKAYWKNTTRPYYKFTAKAADNDGATTTSPKVEITIEDAR